MREVRAEREPGAGPAESVGAEAEEVPACVARLLDAAIAQQASDVYWLPRRQVVQVRVRVRGVQRDVAELPREFGAQCLTHIKVLAGLLTRSTL